MQKEKSHILALLTDLTENVPFQWEEKHQQVFDIIKATLAKKTMLYYPNYNLPFLIFPNASDKQLGGHVTQINTTNIDFTNVNEVLQQDHHSLLFYTCKLSNYQMNYPVIDKELLSIVDLLLEHKNILYGIKIYVYSNHKILTHPNTSHVSAWV